MVLPAGFETTKVVTREANGWRVALTPTTAAARSMLPMHPFVGYGDSESEAAWDAIQSFAAALSKLSEEQREQIKDGPTFDGDAQLLGGATADNFMPTDDEAVARAWAQQEKARRGL